MSDLVSLRVVALGQDEALRDNLSRGAARLSVPMLIESADSAAGLADLLETPADIVLLGPGPAAGVEGDLPLRADAGRALVIALLPAADAPMAIAAVDGYASAPRDVIAAADLLGRLAQLSMPNRILVVDDSPTLRGVVRKILAGSRFIFHVEETGDGAEALRRLGAAPYDYVLLDYTMPGLSGMELLAHIKLEASLANVIVMSSTQDEAVKDRIRRVGAIAFLSKPFYPADIEAVLLQHRGIVPAAQARR